MIWTPTLFLVKFLLVLYSFSHDTPNSIRVSLVEIYRNLTNKPTETHTCISFFTIQHITICFICIANDCFITGDFMFKDNLKHSFAKQINIRFGGELSHGTDQSCLIHVSLAMAWLGRELVISHFGFIFPFCSFAFDVTLNPHATSFQLLSG